MTATVSLGEVAQFVNGLAFRPEDFGARGRPIIRIQNLTDSMKAFNYTTRDLDDKYIVRAGDLLVSWSATLGVFVWDGPDGAVLNQHIFRVIPDERRVDKDYLHRALVVAIIDMGRHLHGATMQHVNRREFLGTRIPLPSLGEQRHIAGILDKADSIRRKRKKAIALTEKLLHSAFLDMVGPGATGYGKWPVRTIESLAADTPSSMRTGPFGSDLLHSEFVDEGIAVLGIDNAVQNRFAWGERRFVTLEKYEKLRRYKVMPGDVLITIMGTTGRSAVVPDDIPSAITTKHLATITLDRNKAEPEFVSQALFRHPEVLRQIDAANRGAIMSGLNLGLIKALRISIPPPARQREFAQVTTRIRALAKRTEDHEYAEKLFSSLMAHAFSGDLHAMERAC